MIMVNNRIGWVSVLLVLCFFFSPAMGWDNLNYAYRVPLETNGTVLLPYSLNDTGRVLFNNSGISYRSILFTNASYIYQNNTNTLIPYSTYGVGKYYYDSAGNDVGYNLLWSDKSTPDCNGCDKTYQQYGIYDYGDSLVAYYHMDTFRNTTIVTDSSIYGNDGLRHGNMSGTLTGPPAWTSTCKHNGDCLDFDGSNDYVNISDEAALDLTDALTMMAWVWKDTISSGQERIISKGADTYNMFLGSGNAPAGYLKGVSPAGFPFTDTLGTGAWHHMAMTYDRNGGSNNRVNYMDGSKSGETTCTGAINTGNLNLIIGAYYTGALQFDGSIDSVRIWNQALSPAEIQAEMDSSLPVETDGLVTAFEFEEGTGTTTYQTGYTATSKIGSAMYFDGVDDYVNVDDSILDGTTEFTINGWIKSESWGIYNFNNVLYQERQSYPNLQTYLAYKTGSGIQLAIGNGTSGTTVTYPVTPNNQQWYLFTATFNNGNVSIYMDGDLKKSEETDITFIDTGTGTFKQIGRMTNLHHFNGLIDEVMIYNRSLSSDEIKQIYKNSMDQFSTIGDLQNLWYYNVTDSADNNIDNVTLTVYNQTNNIVCTTTNGTFELIRQNLPTGNITLLFQAGGYQTYDETLTNTNQYIFRKVTLERMVLGINIKDYYENPIVSVPIDIKITNSTDTFYYGYGHCLLNGTTNNLVDNDMSSYKAFGTSHLTSDIILLPLWCGQNTTVSISADNRHPIDWLELKAYNVNDEVYDLISTFAVTPDTGKKTYDIIINNSACDYDGKVIIHRSQDSGGADPYVYEVWVNQLSQPITFDMDLIDVPSGDITITIDDIEVFDSYSPVSHTTTFYDNSVTEKFYFFKDTETTRILISTIDSTTSNPIPEVDIILYIDMLDDWTIYTRGVTDATGSLTVHLKTDISTRVTATKIGYTKDPFIFTPTYVTDSLTIPMNPEYALNYTYILQGIIYRFEPYDTVLSGTETTNLTFFISSAGDTIDSIAYNVTWNGTNIGGLTSTESAGARLTIPFNASGRTGDVESRAYVIIDGSLLELNISYVILTVTPMNWTFADLKTRIDDETLTNQRFIGVMAAIFLMAAVSGFGGVMHYGVGLVLLGLIGLLTALGFISYMQYAVIIGLAFGIYIMLRGL